MNCFNNSSILVDYLRRLSSYHTMLKCTCYVFPGIYKLHDKSFEIQLTPLLCQRRIISQKILQAVGNQFAENEKGIPSKGERSFIGIHTSKDWKGSETNFQNSIDFIIIVFAVAVLNPLGSSGLIWDLNSFKGIFVNSSSGRSHIALIPIGRHGNHRLTTIKYRTV